MNLIQNTDLIEKKQKILKLKNLSLDIKTDKKILTFGDVEIEKRILPP